MSWSGVLAQDGAPPAALAFDGGLTCVVPVRDLEVATGWYRAHLGFGVEWNDDKLGFAERRDGRVFYIASPRGVPPVEFELDAAASTTTRVVFANPAHDFPKRIAYRLAPDGTPHARVDDGTDGGGHQDFAWQSGGLR